MKSSRRSKLALSLVLVAAALAGCGGWSPAPEESATRASGARNAPKRPSAYTVRRGDTLYSIAWRFGFDYRQIAAWNGIRAPYTIYPGQRLRLTRPPRTPATQTAQRSSSGAAQSGKPRATPKKSASQPVSSEKTSSGTTLKKSGKPAAKGGNAPIKRWHWPTRGKVVTSFSKSGGKGIDIAGKLGQPILAVSDGDVVYSGSGLIGYGQLIIVKHNKRYLSAYAHNNKILVKEGDTVKGGQRIAEMGRGGSNRALLHFEIRRDGRPIDPMRYLPK